MSEEIKDKNKPYEKQKEHTEKPKTPKGKELKEKVENIKNISSKGRNIALNNLKNKINKSQHNHENNKLSHKEKEMKIIETLVSIIYPITGYTKKELMSLIYIESGFDNGKNGIVGKGLMQLTSIAIDDFKERGLTHYKKLFEEIPSEFIKKMRCSSETKLALTKLKTRPDLDKKTYNKLINTVLKEKEKPDVNILMGSIHLGVKYNTTSSFDIKKMESIIGHMNFEVFNKVLSGKNKPTLSKEEFKKLQNIILDYSDPKKTSRLIKYNGDPINKNNYPRLIYYIASLD